MKRIGITQRISSQFHGQPHDCLDTAWTDLLAAMDLASVPLPNMDATVADIASYLSLSNLDGVVLTGGNDVSGFGAERGSETSARREKFERALIEWTIGHGLPMLAVCRGMQFFNVCLGGGLSTIEDHVASTHSLHRTDSRMPAAFIDMPNCFEVNSFHTFAILQDQLADGLCAAAIDDGGFVEAAFHTEHSVAAVMWHPERRNPAHQFDHKMINAVFSD